MTVNSGTFRESRPFSAYWVSRQDDPELAELLAKYPVAVTLSHIVGDWDLGASKVELRSRENPNGHGCLPMVLVHYYTRNSPFDRSDRWAEVISLEEVQDHYAYDLIAMLRGLFPLAEETP